MSHIFFGTTIEYYPNKRFTKSLYKKEVVCSQIKKATNGGLFVLTGSSIFPGKRGMMGSTIFVCNKKHRCVMAAGEKKVSGE
jgi:hypothetical protein